MRLLTTCIGLFVLVAASTASFAGEIRKGATMEVKANSIWFHDIPKLAHWQGLRKSGDAAALESHQDQVLSQREAWQFINPLTVKIVGYRRGENQVDVEMKTAGRMLGTRWWLDADALTR